MKKLLISGFEPFGGEAVNPSWEALSRLPDEIGEYFLIKQRIPVVFEDAANALIKTAEEICPDAILCIGQAGGRDAVTPELVGINLRHASIPDNSGYQPCDEPIVPGGNAAYFSTLPSRRIAQAINAAGIPSRVSYSAGAYVCNDVFYTLLSHFQNTETRVGFIHIPYCDGQNKSPSMKLEQIAGALTAAVKAIDE